MLHLWDGSLEHVAHVWTQTGLIWKIKLIIIFLLTNGLSRSNYWLNYTRAHLKCKNHVVWICPIPPLSPSSCYHSANSGASGTTQLSLLTMWPTWKIYMLCWRSFSPISIGYILRVLETTVCPRSSDQFYIVSYYIKWVTTSWTHSIQAHFLL